MIATLEPIALDLDTPQIYCACLSSYNAGFLHGCFIDATQDPEDIREEIDRMLSSSPIANVEACEEFAIHDYQNFAGVNLHEYQSIDYVSALANAIEEHGKPFALYINYFSFDDIEFALSSFEENYCGCFESIEDYAKDYYEQTGQLDAIVKAGLNSYYINWKSIAHDWQCSGDFLFLEESYNEIHVFYNH